MKERPVHQFAGTIDGTHTIIHIYRDHVAWRSPTGEVTVPSCEVGAVIVDRVGRRAAVTIPTPDGMIRADISWHEAQQVRVGLDSAGVTVDQSTAPC